MCAWRTWGSFGSSRVHSGTPRGRRVHSSSLRFTSALLGFTRVRLGVAGFLFGFAGVYMGAPRGCCVPSDSRGFTIGVAGFIRVRVGSLVRAY